MKRKCQNPRRSADKHAIVIQDWYIKWSEAYPSKAKSCEGAGLAPGRYYGGGIIPPPWFVGPPSTIPGMIYLVLLMGDAYEILQDEKIEESGKSWQELCAEEL